MSEPRRNSISFLLYLTPDDWSAADGGQLRVFEEEVPRDVVPDPGSFVLFDSAAVPHAVLTTRRERLAIVGWFLERRDSIRVPSVD